MRYTEYHSGKPVIKDKALLSGAMKKLAEYEDTGLTTEQVQELKERDTAKRLDTSSKCEEHTHYKCQTCGNILMIVYKNTTVGRITEFCEKCGQRLDRSEV